MKGRPPTPTEQKIATGNPGHRALPAVIVGGGKVLDLPQPDDFSEQELAVWDDVVPEILALGWVDKVDRAQVKLYVRALALAERAFAELAEEDSLIVYTAKGMPSAHPLHRIALAATAQALRHGEQFGLTASARARLGLTTVKGMSMAQELEQRLGNLEVPETIEVEDVEGES